MSSRKERARRRHRFPVLYGVCPNCKEKGPHFVPPGFGSGGFFMCKPKEEKEREES